MLGRGNMSDSCHTLLTTESQPKSASTTPYRSPSRGHRSWVTLISELYLSLLLLSVAFCWQLEMDHRNLYKCYRFVAFCHPTEPGKLLPKVPPGLFQPNRLLAQVELSFHI